VPTHIIGGLGTSGHMSAVNVNPPEPLEIDLLKAYESLKDKFRILVKSFLVLTLSYRGDIKVTLFLKGRMLIRNIQGESEALKIYEDILKNVS